MLLVLFWCRPRAWLLAFLLKFDSSHCILFFWFSRVLLRSDTEQFENLTLSGNEAVGQLELDEMNQSFDELLNDTLDGLMGREGGLDGE